MTKYNKGIKMGTIHFMDSRYRCDLESGLLVDTKDNRSLDKDEVITITYIGIDITKTANWFYGIHVDEIRLPDTHIKYYNQIEMADIIPRTNVLKKYKRNYTTKEPIMLDDKHAITLVPRNRIAISKDSLSMVDIFKRIPIKHKLRNRASGYRYITYDRVENMVHHLVATAWKYNDDLSFKIYIDHIDGNILNNHADNLNWVTPSENTLKANRVITNNTPCVIKHYLTDEQHTFDSISSAVSYVGIKYIPSINDIKNNKLGMHYNGWEIRLIDSNKPWFYNENNRTLIDTQASYKYDVYDLHANKYLKTFYKVTDVNKFVGLPVDTAMINLAKKLKERNLPYYVKVTSLIKDSGIEVLDIKTGNIKKFKTQAEVSKYLNVDINVIRRTLKGQLYNRNINGYLIKDNIRIPWPKDEEIIEVKPKTNKVKAVNIYTNEEIIYDSIREASRKQNVTRKTLKNYLDTDNAVKGFKYYRV